MTLFRGERVIGRYGGSPVTSLFRQQVLAIQRAGGGVVNARTLLRNAGFRFRNQAVTDIFREIRGIDAKATRLNSIRNDFRPTRATISRVNMRFRTRFRYSGRVRLRDALSGERIDFNVTFGDDRLLTSGEIREGIERIAEKGMAKGGPGYFEEPELVSVSLTSVLEGERIE